MSTTEIDDDDGGRGHSYYIAQAFSENHRIRFNIFLVIVEDNATMSSIRYFENHVSYFVQNRRK